MASVFVGHLLGPESSTKTREAVLRCMAACALRDDVSLLLHQDRRHHQLLNYAHQLDTHPRDEQKALALFVSTSTSICSHSVPTAAPGFRSQDRCHHQLLNYASVESHCGKHGPTELTTASLIAYISIKVWPTKYFYSYVFFAVRRISLSLTSFYFFSDDCVTQSK